MYDTTVYMTSDIIRAAAATTISMLCTVVSMHVLYKASGVPVSRERERWGGSGPLKLSSKICADNLKKLDAKFFLAFNGLRTVSVQWYGLWLTVVKT